METLGSLTGKLETVDLCPQCGSAKVEVLSGSEIVGGVQVSCTNCDWTGKQSELITAMLPKDGSLVGDAALSVAQEVALSYLRLISKLAGAQIGLAMVESGITGRKDKYSLTRLIRAACIGAHRATLDEIGKMQEEMSGQSTTS